MNPNRSPAATRAHRACALVILLALGACATEWSAEDWARSRPELEGVPLGRLDDATPYFFAADDTLVAFWCRWSLEEPLVVDLPPDATPAERRLLARALRAWESAVPGLRFEERARRGPASISVAFSSDENEGAETATDCAVERARPDAAHLEARLVRARISLRRQELDAWGRPVELGPPELLGTALHELGHALGFQGHARNGRTVMVREGFDVRRVGQRVLGGGPLHEPAVAALYRVPSGTVVERVSLAAGATEALDLLAARAAHDDLRLHVRVGDSAARVQWGRSPDLTYYLKDPRRLLTRPGAFASALIQASGS